MQSVEMQNTSFEQMLSVATIIIGLLILIRYFYELKY